MTLAVTDANIFIDLFELKLLGQFFELELNIYSTQEVLLECDKALREELEVFIQKEKLTIQSISDDDVEEMDKMNFNKGLSEPDRSVLFVAKKQKGIVVSGDKLIRKWCKQNQIEVHGILWVLDEMESSNILNPKEAIEKLQSLLQINFWLPTNAANELIEKWKKDL